MLDKKLLDRIEATGKRTSKLKKKTAQEFWEIVLECSSILKEIHPTKRKLWLSDVINEMFHSQNGLCALCSTQLEVNSIQVDHIIPFTYGGGNEHNNLQLAHGECNNHKRDKVNTLELLKYLESRYMNLPPNNRIILSSSSNI